MTVLKDLRLTLFAIILAGALVATASLTNIDLVKLDLKLIQRIEQHEVDDVLSGLTLIAIALVIDLSRRRKRHRAEIEAQRVRTLKTTMRTVQGIVNNFLDNLLRFEMEVKGVVPPHSLDRLDELTQETYDKLKALGDLDNIG